MRRFKTGTTLIELMVVLAIIGIMSTIAIVAYDQYLRKSKQENLKAQILEAASAQERHFTARGRYATAMSELVQFGLKGKAGTNGWEAEKTTLYTGLFINNRTGLAYWVAGNSDIDKSTETLEDCWLYLSRNAAQHPAVKNGLAYLYDDASNTQNLTLAGINNSVVCKP